MPVFSSMQSTTPIGVDDVERQMRRTFARKSGSGLCSHMRTRLRSSAQRVRSADFRHAHSLSRSPTKCVASAAPVHTLRTDPCTVRVGYTPKAQATRSVPRPESSAGVPSASRRATFVSFGRAANHRATSGRSFFAVDLPRDLAVFQPFAASRTICARSTSRCSDVPAGRWLRAARRIRPARARCEVALQHDTSRYRRRAHMEIS